MYSISRRKFDLSGIWKGRKISVNFRSMTSNIVLSRSLANWISYSVALRPFLFGKRQRELQCWNRRPGWWRHEGQNWCVFGCGGCIHIYREEMPRHHIVYRHCPVGIAARFFLDIYTRPSEKKHTRLHTPSLHFVLLLYKNNHAYIFDQLNFHSLCHGALNLLM